MLTTALIFDFDGLILDTETPELTAWETIYSEYGQVFPVTDWGLIVGSTDAYDFEPMSHLETLVGRDLDRAEIQRRHRADTMARIVANDPLPGVLDLLDQANARGLRLAIASSSPLSWVGAHLLRLGLTTRFSHIVTADDVTRTKPDPSLFLTACRHLNVDPGDTIVFEDSPNGILAAQRAGIFCVAVPNVVTRQLDLGTPNLVLDSLADMTLETLLATKES